MITKLKYTILLLVMIQSTLVLYSQTTVKASVDYFGRNPITIASEPDYPPYCFINEEGEAAGFAVDLFNAAAKAAGLDVKIKIGIWNIIKQDLAEGKIDALPLVGRTPEREKLYDFTLPYLSLHGAVFVRKGTEDINSIEDLKEKEIAVMKGDNAEEYIRRDSISSKIFTTNTFEEAFQKLASGKHDAVIMQRITGLKLLETMGVESIVPLDIQLPKFRQDFCFAVKKGDKELLTRLNEGLSIIIANDTFEKIRIKWFGPTIKEELSLKDILTITLYVFIPLLIIMSILSIIFLRKEIRRQTQSLNDEIEEHKKTLAQLNKQKLLLNEMEKVSKTGGWEYEVATKQITWTDGVYHIHGVSPSEFDPSNYDDDIQFYSQEDQNKLNNAFQESLSKKKPYNLELKFISKDGIKKWVHTSGYPVIQNNEVIRLVGNITDITETKLALETIKVNEERIRLLLDSTAEGIYGIDLNGSCTFCNRSALQMLGYDDESDVIGKNMHDLIHHKTIEGKEISYEECKIFKAFKNDYEIKVFDEVFWKADGSYIDIEYSSYPLKSNNTILGAVITFSDISGRNRLINELQATKEYLENLINYSNVPIIVWNKEFEIERFNRAFEKLTGLSTAEVLGKKIDLLFPGSKAAESFKIIQTTAAGNKLESVEIDIKNSANNERTILWNSSNLYDAKGNLTATIAQGYDVTDRNAAQNELMKLKNRLEMEVEDRTAELKQNVEKLNKSQRAMLFMVEDLNNVTSALKEERHKLELSNKELEAFSYSVSHDLRAPLRAIDGFSKFLLEDYYDKIDDEGKRLLNIIRQNASQMDRLITDILNLSRISRSEMKTEKIDMTAIAKAMYHETATPEEKDVFEITINKMPKAECDITLIKQVWQNLIGNALKYSSKSESKKIIIGCIEEKDKNIYYVKDLGAGFNSKYISKLFRLFQRLHRADEYEGTGVGLAIVQRIIHRHGGEVWAEGEVGKGATFYFSLPK